jgi:hypothetical protein
MLSRNQGIFVVAVLSGLAFAQFGKAADPCKSNPTILLNIPGWDEPVRLTPADRIRCGHEALASVPQANTDTLPLPYHLGGPLPPAVLHLWSVEPHVLPWPEEKTQ